MLKNSKPTKSTPKSNENQLTDRYKRHLNYLRVSITDRCNLQCMYCVPRNLIQKLPHDEILRYEEILHIVKLGVRLGIKKIRVTGGEPLVRKGVYEFLGELTRIRGLSDVSLTTNGVFLKDNIEKITSAGIRRINVSLDTLHRDKFLEITGHDLFGRVWDGIMAAHGAGISPIKINVVALQGINDEELVDMAKLSYTYPFHVRFIEYMPIGKTRRDIGTTILVPEIKSRLRVLGQLLPVENLAYDGPAERCRLEGAVGEVGFISALSHHFCDRCNRLRLTANGQLRACLLSDTQEDLKGPLREGRSDEELAEIFFKTVRNKPIEHSVALQNPSKITAQMCTIGG
jgi:GTP 3',8-cyclase